MERFFSLTINLSFFLFFFGAGGGNQDSLGNGFVGIVLNYCEKRMISREDYHEAVTDQAIYLGMDPEEDEDLLW